MRTIAGAALAVILLAGCNGEAATEANPDSAPTAGCTKAETEELYVTEKWECTGADLYLFSTPTARDSWRQTAEEFGANVTASGDTWLKVSR